MVSLDGGDGTGALSGLSERGQLATAGTTLRVSIKVQQEPEEAKSNCGVKGGIYYDLILQLSYLQSLNPNASKTQPLARALAMRVNV